MNDINPFRVASQVGNAFARQQETSQLDEILKQSMASNDPNVQNDAIRQILTQVSPERRPEALQAIQFRQQQLAQIDQQQRQQEAQQLARQRQEQAYKSQGLAPEIAGLDPSVQREIIKSNEAAKKKVEEGKDQVRNAFQRTQEILESGYTGYTPLGLTPEGRKTRAELDTLSEVFISHLIPLLNPRGVVSKERFNYIKSLVPNSSDTDAKIKGKLKALQEIFKLDSEESKFINQKAQVTGEKPKERPPLSSFFRR